MSESTIHHICGLEPMRSGEYPSFFRVGDVLTNYGPIKSIVRREENYGDHGLLWFDVLGEDDNVMVSIQGRAVAEIVYQVQQ